MKYKVMTIVGTRPEIIKLSQVINKFDLYFDHTLVHTGQNFDYGLSDVFFEELKIRKPDLYLNAVGKNLGETMGNIISYSFSALSDAKPDALVVLGDTNSALSVISAKRLKIPVFHIEAGNRSFDENLPEEINRRLIDHISDVNITYSEQASRNLLREGLNPEFVFKSGSPMTEIITNNLESVLKSDVLKKLELQAEKFMVISIHREENVDNDSVFASIVDAINKIANHFKMPIIFSVHPRTRKKINEKNVVFDPLVKLLEPLGFFDFLCLQKNAFVVLSDSGTLAEESSILKYPAVSVRTSTERPESFEKGMFSIGSIDSNTLINAINFQVEYRDNSEDTEVLDYVDQNFSKKVTNIVLSYINIVNCKIWRKKE